MIVNQDVSNPRPAANRLQAVCQTMKLTLIAKHKSSWRVTFCGIATVAHVTATLIPGHRREWGRRLLLLGRRTAPTALQPVATLPGGSRPHNWVFWSNPPPEMERNPPGRMAATLPAALVREPLLHLVSEQVRTFTATAVDGGCEPIPDPTALCRTRVQHHQCRLGLTSMQRRRPDSGHSQRRHRLHRTELS